MCVSVLGEIGAKEEERLELKETWKPCTGFLVHQAAIFLFLSSQPGKWEAQPSQEWLKHTEDSVELHTSSSEARKQLREEGTGSVPVK